MAGKKILKFTAVGVSPASTAALTLSELQSPLVLRACTVT
jgi:hypothetical protein